MQLIPAYPTFDDPLAAEVESSDILMFEPASRPDDDYAALVSFHGIETERLVLVDPHADSDSTSESAQRLADLSDILASDGWQIAIIGDAVESILTGAVLGSMQTGALYLAGAMSAQTLATLIADARLVLSERAEGSDVAREAQARGTPLICIDSHSDADTPATLAERAIAALHAQGAAHPGTPFTLHSLHSLHSPMLEDAA